MEVEEGVAVVVNPTGAHLQLLVLQQAALQAVGQAFVLILRTSVAALQTRHLQVPHVLLITVIPQVVPEKVFLLVQVEPAAKV